MNIRVFRVFNSCFIYNFYQLHDLFAKLDFFVQTQFYCIKKYNIATIIGSHVVFSHSLNYKPSPKFFLTLFIVSFAIASALTAPSARISSNS